MENLKKGKFIENNGKKDKIILIIIISNNYKQFKI